MSFDPDALAHLEDERSFLLRSLRDLEREHEAGDVDDTDYAELRDGYTKRAADVLAEIDAGQASRPERPPTDWRRRVAVVAAVALIGGFTGWLVARSSGQRLSGESLTGDIIGGDREAALLSEARMLLGGDIDSWLAAGQLYAEVLESDPGNAEALTYSGWVAFLLSRQSGLDPNTVATAQARAVEQLDGAIAADPEYADPLCFRAIVANSLDESDEALDYAERCLALDPPAGVEDLMTPFVARLEPTPTTT